MKNTKVQKAIDLITELYQTKADSALCQDLISRLFTIIQDMCSESLEHTTNTLEMIFDFPSDEWFVNYDIYNSHFYLDLVYLEGQPKIVLNESIETKEARTKINTFLRDSVKELEAKLK